LQTWLDFSRFRSR